jgi:hypothetical protein
MNLNEQQKAKRKEVLTTMVKQYKESHPWLTTRQAVYEVGEILENDPVQLRIINALSASATIEGSINVKDHLLIQ